MLSARGVIAADLLARAWELLARELPLLRSRIVDEADNYAVEIGTAAPPLVELSAEAGTLVAIVHRPWNVGDPVAQAILVQDSDTCAMVVALHHALADGRLTVTLLQKLAHYYFLVATGNPAHPPLRSHFELPLEQRLERFRGTVPAQHFNPSIDVARLPRPDYATDANKAEFEVRNLRFDHVETTRVEVLAKRWGVSVNSVLSATALAALRAMLDSPDPMPLGIGYPVDLRNRIDPPLPADAELCCVASWSVVSSASPDVDVRECSSAIQETLDKAIAAEAPQSAMANGVSDTWRTNSISLSNLGRLDLPQAPDGLVFENIRFIVASPVPHPAIFVTCAGGQLNLDVVYSRSVVSNRHGKHLAERIERTLRALPGSDS
ncbi:phthiocerol/phthiodiolone dimycocerosyl transferase family protein [Nocardia seriolae]|uniref:phthiocerol/phthiodiolone dimycocerosyl transferase family protein n=1 Tax=Nocardia seriolae TaxID=37332 RepID=UPI0008F4824E|nr:hypothetical protein [Nocardia seriolae]